MILASGFAMIFWTLGASYPRPYLRAWRWMWATLAFYAFASGAALLASGAADLAILRVPLTAIAVLAAWFHLGWLEEGMRRLCAPDSRTPRWRLWTVGGALAAALVLSLLPSSTDRAVALDRYLVRLSLFALAWGLAYASAGWMILQSTERSSALGRRFLGYALLSYGVLRALEPLAHVPGTSPILSEFLAFGGIPLLVAVLSGMGITLLEVEGTRAVHEIEARMTAERTATASEALLASALASSTDPVLVVDPHGRLMTFNDGFATLIRTVRGTEAVAGMPLEAIIGTETTLLWRDAFARALHGESQTRTESFVLFPDSPPTQFGILVSPVRREGDVIGVLFVAHNATQEEQLRVTLKRREEWFRSMIENSSDVIIQVGPDGTVDYASSSLARVLGYSPDAILGDSAFEYVHPDDVAHLREAMEKSFARDETAPSSVPFRARAASGGYVALEAVSRPYGETDGAPRLIVSVRDVSERRRLEAELLAARRLESVGRLAGGVAHDFNNLLTAIVGNLSLIRASLPAAPVESVTPDTPLAPDTPVTLSAAALAGHLDEIDSAVHRGAELTRRLLAFARRQMIEPRVLQFAPYVADLDRLLRRLIGDAIRLEVTVPADLWSVRMDPLAFEQILVNLVLNSRDAMPKGGVISIIGRDLTISAAGPQVADAPSDLPAGDWVRLDVRDDGTGIEETILSHIFEPFFTTKGDSGTGLGLATVYGAVGQAGGQIRVRSAVGKGTTFSLFFPRVVESAVRSEAGAAASALARARALPGERILLIDDEESVRVVTAKLLTRLGYEVMTAHDGQDGVAKAALAGDLHAVVSDLTMPVLGGVDAVGLIHQTRPALPVVFISGYSEQALNWEHGAPANGRLLTKPFTVDDLARTIRAAIDEAGVRASLDDLTPPARSVRA